MITINDTVIKKPVFEKVSELTMTGDITKWHEMIMNQFFEEVDFLPQNIGVDVVLSAVDTNKGYGKGSVVVWFKRKKINFPIIIKNFKLSPFDVMVYNANGEQKYLPANFENIKRIISTDQIGVLENIWDKGNNQMNSIKTPGGVYPKQLIPITDQPIDMTYPPFAKMSGWRERAYKEDLEKFSTFIESNPEIKANYVDNTGDLITNIINLANSKKQIITDTDKVKNIDLKGLVSAKRAITIIDSEIFDVNQLQPIFPPAVCELRLYEYPTMEDFLESGENMSERFMATKNGKPIVGIVLDMKDTESLSYNSPAIEHASMTNLEKEKLVRQPRDQIFISLDGSCYSEFYDYSKTGIGFYGSKIIQVVPGMIDKVLKIISNNISDDFTFINEQNRYDGSDKLFNPIDTMDQGQQNIFYNCPRPSKLVVIYGANNCFECIMFRGNYKKIIVNGSPVYTSQKTVIIPANVAIIQKVKSVKDKVYQIAALGANEIFLIPETSIVINTKYMHQYQPSEFLRPNLPIQKIFEDANISKTSVEIDANAGGYRIVGEPYDNLKKIAGDKPLSTKSAINALHIMGMEKKAAETALKHVINRYLNKNASDKKVFIYGLRGDYINPEFKIEKKSSHEEVLKKIASILRKNLIKEASALNNPDAVDVVLSLNFINKDNLIGFINNIGEMKRILSELSKMLIASRLGLSDLDESAIKKTMEGLDDVIHGLENIKLAIK